MRVLDRNPRILNVLELQVQLQDEQIATLVHRFYERVLAPPAQDSVGKDLGRRFATTLAAVLEITGNERLLESNPVIRRSIAVRNPYVDPINVLQAGLLKLFRETPDDRVRDALHITINGIAAGLQNTG